MRPHSESAEASEWSSLLAPCTAYCSYLRKRYLDMSSPGMGAVAHRTRPFWPWLPSLNGILSNEIVAVWNYLSDLSIAFYYLDFKRSAMKHKMKQNKCRSLVYWRKILWCNEQSKIHNFEVTTWKFLLVEWV